jgi:hypothetical protein
MNTNKNFFKISAVVSFSVLASALTVGCGGAPQTNLNAIGNTVASNINSIPTAVTTPVVTSIPATATDGTLNGAYNYSFELQNTVRSCNNSGSPTPNGVAVGSYSTSGISTDNIFKVTLTSGAPTSIPCTGYTANYSCVQYTVTVGARSQTATVSYGTPPQGSPCANLNATNSVTLDFSDQATVGHGPLAVKVSQPQSDNCHANPYAYAWYGAYAVQYTGCQMAPVYDNQIVSGTLSIVTNHQ